MEQSKHLLYAALDKCRDHPVMGQHVQWIDIDFALSISNPDFKTKTDLGFWEQGKNPENQADLNALVADILARGMRDPFIVGIGSKHSRIRLETGNQRVRALAAHQVSRIPVVGLYSDEHITNAGNGIHEGLEVQLLKPNYFKLLGPYQERRYCRLSDEAFHPALKFYDQPH